jgi:hypothetical protein
MDDQQARVFELLATRNVLAIGSTIPARPKRTRVWHSWHEPTEPNFVLLRRSENAGLLLYVGFFLAAANACSAADIPRSSVTFTRR